MLATSIVILLIPLWILLGLVVIVFLLGLLGRIQNGRYLRPVVAAMSKVPFLKRMFEKASRAAIELANPQQAQKVMSRLTREERAALLEMQEQQGGAEPEVTNRQMRRQLEKQRKRR